MLGFVIGVARLSPNWLLAKIAAAYVEVMRNIPLLLQLFFWYFAVLRPLPGPAESIEALPGVFLSNRGLIVPDPVFDAGAGLFFGALAAAIVSWLCAGPVGAGAAARHGSVVSGLARRGGADCRPAASRMGYRRSALPSGICDARCVRF